MSFYPVDSDQETDIKLNSKRRFSVHNQTNQTFGLKSKGTCHENNTNNNNNNNKLRIDQIKNKPTYKKLTNLIKSKNCASPSLNSSNKGVQFETAKNRKLSTIKTRHTIVKPILKLNSDYFSIPMSDGCSSISSNDSNEPISSKSLKLPPIARCSDDFYAVLKDLEQEEQMN